LNSGGEVDVIECRWM